MTGLEPGTLWLQDEFVFLPLTHSSNVGYNPGHKYFRLVHILNEFFFTTHFSFFYLAKKYSCVSANYVDVCMDSFWTISSVDFVKNSILMWIL